MFYGKPLTRDIITLGTIRTSHRFSSVHRLRGHVFTSLLLGFFPLLFGTHSRDRGYLASQRN